jgi:hypothetical protein
MGAPRGKRTSRPGPDDGDEGGEDRVETTVRVPDLVRRVLGLGFSGLFVTEEVLRKALGDSLPRDWVDFAVQQSTRTRRDLIERVAGEIGRSLDGIDLQRLAERLLRGHTLEVSARIRFLPAEEPAPDAAPAAGRRAGRVGPSRREPGS